MRQRTLVCEPWSGCGPAEAASALRTRPHLAWLDSALPHSRHGRWSIVACDPRWLLTAHARRVRFSGAAGVREAAGDPLRLLSEAVEAEQAQCVVPDAKELPFFGGAIGYLGFELGRQIERLPATTLDDVGAPDLAVGWYDAALLWDHVADAGWLVGTPAAIGGLRSMLTDGLATTQGRSGTRPAAQRCAVETRANLSRDSYLRAVERALRYIEAGDIYQVNLSQRFSAPLTESGLAVYERLREVSAAPFAGYLSLGGVEVLSSSPERLLLADGEHLETRPIKGTRRRGGSAAEDDRLARQLLASEKDRAEHIMIVDLARNDLGRVAEIGSVQVPELASLESYAQVHHLTSTVTARRRADAGLDSLLRAIFPGGSISGAPKIRALQIIDELEPTVRGVYTGAIGYMSAHGRLDLNVAIRTVTVRDGVAHMHAGSAIVHDSDPESEYRETLDKARGMARALAARLPDEPLVADPASPPAVPASAV